MAKTITETRDDGGRLGHHGACRRPLVVDWRSCRADLFASSLLFLVAALAAGRVFRFPFDDEIYTLRMIGNGESFFEMLTALLNDDIHPPLSYAMFFGLRALGFDEAGMRGCSLALTGAAMALMHALAFSLMTPQSGEPPSLAARLTAIMVFALGIIAVHQGDALRWYPLFAFLTASFIYLYLTAGDSARALVAAAALGLAGAVNFLVILIAAPFAVYRYGLERRFRLKFELAFWLIAGLFAAPGAATLGAVLLRGIDRYAQTQLEHSAISAVGNLFVGYFGGYSLGVSQFWIVVPMAGVAIWACVDGVRRDDPTSPVHWLLLMIAAAALPGLAGFGKPRSFVYLAPIVSVVVVIFLNHRIAAGRESTAIMLIAAYLAGALGSLAAISGTRHPFKRNLALPVREVSNFIAANQGEATLIVTTDIVIEWRLAQEMKEKFRCISRPAPQFLGRCLESGVAYDTVIVVLAPKYKKQPKSPNKIPTEILAGKNLIARYYAGVDEEAALKSQLTNTSIPPFLLDIAVYR